MQQGRGQQVARAANAIFAGHLRAADRQQGLAEQLALVDPGPVAGAIAHGHVHAVGDEVGQPFLDPQLEVGARGVGQQALQAGRQPAVGELRVEAHDQGVAGGGGGELRHGVLQEVEPPRDAGGQPNRLRSRDHGVAVSLEEPGAELRLELADLLADGPVGDRQLLRRAAVAAVPGRGLEGAQGEEGRQASHGQDVSGSNNLGQNLSLVSDHLRS